MDDVVIVLVTRGGEQFNIPLPIAKTNEAIYNLVDDFGFEDPIKLYDDYNNNYDEIIQWCKDLKIKK